MNFDSYLMWLSAQPPEIREAVGFADYYLALCPSPRMLEDEPYMNGWNAAQVIGVRGKNSQGEELLDGELINQDP